MKCTKEYRLAFTEQAQALVAQMTLEEKVGLMSGWAMPANGGPPFESEHYNYKTVPRRGQ